MYPLCNENRFKDYNFEDIKKSPIIKFLQSEDVLINHGCGVECYIKYKDDKNNFIFLDPPYMQLNNDFYQNKTINIYEYLYHNNINDNKAFTVLILEDIWIIRMLFNTNKFIDSNDKKYQTTKKKTLHITISN